MIKFPGLGEAWRRTVREDRIIDFLMLRAWPLELRRGERDAAEREARAALDGLIALGLACHVTDSGERLFDPVEVTNFLVWAGRKLGDPTLRQKNIPSARRLIRETHGLSGGESLPPPPAALGTGRYKFTLRRSFNLAGRPVGKRVRLRLPVPLEDEALSDLQIEFLPPPDVDVESAPGPARLDVIAAVPQSGEITAGICATFSTRRTPCADQPGTLDPAEVDLYTCLDEGLIKVTDRVSDLALRLAGDERDTWAVMRRFWAFFLDHLAVDAIHYDRLDPVRPLDTILETGWTDCRLGSALFAALCRARGIPARIVNGYMLYVQAPVIHSWVEVLVEGTGWRPIDLFSWILTDDHWNEADWSHYFFGQLDHRIVLERPPLLFGGTGAVRLPPAWHLLNYANGPGFETEFRAIDTGELVYREYVELERLDQPESISVPE
ncbi:MAG: transglutaminase-like domain-containing protein [Sphingomonadaceae bacterium]|nr:transglutaminase-like domain-containing protein [Sphingomonadaceae bacterium]